MDISDKILQINTPNERAKYDSEEPEIKLSNTIFLKHVVNVWYVFVNSEITLDLANGKEYSYQGTYEDYKKLVDRIAKN